MTQAQKRFAAENGASTASVRRFVWLSKEYVRYSEHAMNGDAFDGVSAADKSACAAKWDALAESIAAEMEKLARAWGFDHLDFGVGMYPTLQRTGDDCTGTVMFPY